MKRSFAIKFMALAIISVLTVTAIYAKPNTKAASYKSYEVSATDTSAPVVYFIRDITPEALQDEEGYMTLPIRGGVRLKENYVGSHFKNYQTYLILSRFKGHAMGGFGGAIKNISIGFASGMSYEKSGKLNIHSAGRSVTRWISAPQDEFLESMAEATKSVCDYMGGGKGIVCINVMNRLSVDCDCDANPAESDMHDIGILASLDPVALDQACVDLVYKAQDSGSLIERIESRHGIHTLEHAEKIGFGSRKYRLVEIK